MCGLTTSIWFRIALPCLCILCLRGTVASTAFIMGTVVCKAIVTVELLKIESNFRIFRLVASKHSLMKVSCPQGYALRVRLD